MSPTTIIAGLVLCGALALAGFQAKQAADARAELAQYREKVATDTAKLVQAHATETARRIKTQSEVINAETIKTQAAQADARRAVAAGQRLQYALSAAGVRFSAADPGATGECQAARSAASVLAELLGQCSEQRREIARFADESHGAGRICQRSYEALSP